MLINVPFVEKGFNNLTHETSSSEFGNFASNNLIKPSSDKFFRNVGQIFFELIMMFWYAKKKLYGSYTEHIDCSYQGSTNFRLAQNTLPGTR